VKGQCQTTIGTPRESRCMLRVHEDRNARIHSRDLQHLVAATFAIANLPCAVMLRAVAVVSFRYAAFPVWLGWISVVAAGAQLLLWCGTVVSSGPLAPNGWLIYVPYPLFLVWLVPTMTVMIKRSGKTTSAP
jgi:hypothetical protein